MLTTKRERLILALALILVLTAIICYPSFSKEKESAYTQWGHITFSAEGGSSHFFDSSTGNVYEYSSTTGKLRHIWTLEELGKDLKQVK